LQIGTFLIGIMLGGFWATVLAVITVSVALQFGYLAGAIARTVWQGRAPRKTMPTKQLGPPVSASERAGLPRPSDKTGTEGYRSLVAEIGAVRISARTNVALTLAVAMVAPWVRALMSRNSWNQTLPVQLLLQKRVAGLLPATILRPPKRLSARPSRFDSQAPDEGRPS
jgi:hypothetical protein